MEGWLDGSMNVQELKAESKRMASVLTVIKVSKSQVSLAFVKHCQLFLSTSIYITQCDYLPNCIMFSAYSSLSFSLLSCLLWHWFLSFIILFLSFTGLKDKNCSCSFSCYLKIRAYVLNVLVFFYYTFVLLMDNIRTLEQFNSISLNIVIIIL